MAKQYSEKYLLSLNGLNEKRLGVQLGRKCVKANLPPSMISKALGVSRMSVYSWFRGSPIRNKTVDKIEKLIDIIDQYIEAGELPVSSTIDAKKFIDAKVIDKL
jgi:predicted transcriptional regulator